MFNSKQDRGLVVYFKIKELIYLQETANSQNIKFLARSLSTGSATTVFHDEGEDKDVATPSVTLFSDRYYTFFDVAIPELKEDRHYTLIITASSVDIHRAKVFVTNQTVADYSINNGEYLERSTTNEFLYD